MVDKKWEVIKVCYCQRVDQEVALEAEMIYAAEFLPDQPARILAHRCSEGMHCNQDDRSACMWAGTNPVFDPFLDVL
jgi:hypothetical protein